jgi:hypothetical protein
MDMEQSEDMTWIIWLVAVVSMFLTGCSVGAQLGRWLDKPRPHTVVGYTDCQLIRSDEYYAVELRPGYVYTCRVTGEHVLIERTREASEEETVSCEAPSPMDSNEMGRFNDLRIFAEYPAPTRNDYHFRKGLNMAQYRKKPVVIDATQWWKNGDHPDDGDPSTEGAVVRYFRVPDIKGDAVCSKCKRLFREHGWIDTLEGGHIVCPGDWIITGVAGEQYPCKPDIFERTYDAVEDEKTQKGEQGHGWNIPSTGPDN